MEIASPIITLENVTAGYRHNAILENVSFSVKRGEIFILLGGSGCGKSTLMKHMIGLNPILSGMLEICSLEWSARTRATLSRKIGVMYQSGALFGSMNVLGNVTLPLEEFTSLKKAARIEKAMALLKDVGLEDAAAKLPGEISGGMKKRVAIARALALDPEVIFLDEPSAGLDPITANALDDLILKLRANLGTTFVVVSHELESIRKIADRCAMFDKARKSMIALGSIEELVATSKDPFVKQFFSRGKINV